MESLIYVTAIPVHNGTYTVQQRLQFEVNFYNAWIFLHHVITPSGIEIRSTIQLCLC
jgi:hypothetical protein